MREREGHVWRATALILARLVVLAASQNYSRTIYVDPSNGADSDGCVEHPGPDNACRSLDFVFQPQYRESSTRYLLQPGTHRVKSSNATDIPFTDLSDLAVVGNSSDGSVAILCVGQNTGLAFVNVTNLVLESVTFDGCASQRNSTSLQNVFYELLAFVQVALYFSHCEDLTLSRVSVLRSPNATGVVAYNTIGKNTFTDCKFSENSSPELLGGGGGVYVEFSYCLPGNKSCFNATDEDIALTDHNANSTYTFENCSFSRNNASNRNPTTGGTTYILPHHQNHEAFGRGGGLSFFFKANATGNRVEIRNCSFLENRALWGAGVFVEFQDTATGNSFLLSDSKFKGNELLAGVNTAGGGVRIGHYIFGSGVVKQGNSIVVENCLFTSNTGVSGGGFSFSPAGQQTSGDLASLSLTNCIFIDNSGFLGMAVHLMRFALTAGQVPCVAITNIVVQGSSLATRDPTKAYQLAGGALYISRIPVDFTETAQFTHNEATGVIIVGADANFENCTGTFDSNMGLKGGGLLLLGISSLVVNELTVLNFTNNTATWRGGGIYKQYDDRDNMVQDPHCFIRHANPFLDPDDWGSSFHFVDNSDPHGRIAIHATSLYPCVWAGGKSVGDVSHVFCWKNWFYNHNLEDSHCSRHLSSYAGNITYEYNITLFPGLETQLPIVAKDDLNRTRQVYFHAVSQDPETAQVDSAFEYVADNTIKFTGIEGQSFKLELDTSTQRVWHLEMNITVRLCPPGFLATNSTNQSVCSCRDNAFDGELICADEGYSARLSGGMWMGRIKNMTLAGHCPPQYCLTVHHRKYNLLPQDFESLESHLCGEQHRKGTLCGECKSGYGPAINSRSKRFDCILCSDVNIARQITIYALLEYVPLLLLFLAIIFFNIKLTTAPANAFILYSQVISSTFDLTADGQIPLKLSGSQTQALLLAYQFPYGIFNLRFFEQLADPLCLSSRFNVLDVLVLDYGVCAFPLFMILVVIGFVKIKGCCGDRCHSPCSASSTWARFRQVFPRFGDSIIPAFTSFLLLSYSKFVLTSSYLISQHSLIDNAGDYSEMRVYYAGQYSVSDPEYVLRYMIPAVIILLVVGVLPPLLLLHYPLQWFEAFVGKFEWLKRHYPSTKVHIFLDAFQGCFRPKMRGFAGLYFIFRLVIDLSYTLTPTWIEQYTVQATLCIVFAFILTLCRPYTDEYRIFNFVDVAMFANLAVITILGFYIYSVIHINPVKNPPPVAFCLQYILVFLPLLCMLGYLLWCYVIPRVVLLCHRLAGNINYRDADSLHGSLFINSRASGSAWGALTTSVSHPGAGRTGRRSRRRNLETSVDWQRATLKNTYCRSPTAHENAESAAESEEGVDSTSALESANEMRTPLLQTTATYVTAPAYGTCSSTSTNTMTTGTSDERTNQWDNQQGHPSTHGNSNE